MEKLMFPDVRPNSKAPITLTIAQGIGPMLDALPQKPKAALTARDVVDMNRAAVLSALKKGYGFSDIAEMLVTAGVKISGSTLAHYVRDKGPTAQTAGAAKEKAKAKSPAAQSKNTAP